MTHHPLPLAVGGDFMPEKVVLGLLHVAAAVLWLAYGRRADEQREAQPAAATPAVVGRQAAENANLVRNGGMLLGFIAMAFVIRAAIDVYRGPRTQVMVENLTFGVVGYVLPGLLLWFLAGRGVERSRALCLLIV